MKSLTILDGGMGRELQEIGAPFSQPLWSAQALIESPEHVRQAHQNFIDAGAEIIIANSYACVPFHLGAERYEKEGALLAQKAAQIAASVARASDDVSESQDRVKSDCRQGALQQSVRVAGAIPPPLGSYRPDLFQAEQAEPVIETLYNAQDPYVDLWIVETISSFAEFEVTHRILKVSNKPTYYAFSLSDADTDNATLRSGESLNEAIQSACSLGVDGVMFNCSVPEVMAQAIQQARAVIEQSGREVTIGVYANNFMPIKTDHEANGTLQSMRALSPDDYLTYAKQWHQLGASIIGGCCGISPDHIRALTKWKLDQNL
ncbi:homocysteine S-methyltransferase family protein [Vibrio methylphosphonaticus]|uniref:homocysteine S-methyltransferase family protein n=1 Tax=Vibrio methylphosphonaticus TaxID=2946866 RepID=UPI002029E652|nr:homocysteine S-methyltransferase family protein [Vibrio methylphosphonaticus]MCL9774979.1 homocysteine S-methyltransferase family protein [Vibrio methylphosphonaticus]